MKKAIKRFRIIPAVILVLSLLFTSLTADVSAAVPSDITVNHSDSLSRLFVNRPDY